MAKKLKKLFSTVLIMCILVSALPIRAFAETSYSVETSPEGLPTNVATSTDISVDENGNTTLTISIKEDTAGTLSDGTELERHESTTENYYFDEMFIYTGDDGVNEGNEARKNILELPEGGVSVEIPDEAGESSSANFGDTSMNGIPTGDVKKSADDDEYKQTTTNVTPGSVTVTTTKVEGSESFGGESELEFVTSQTTPSDENDLNYVNGKAPDEYLPGYEGESPAPTLEEGYDYLYVGSGNTSMYVPAIVFDAPMSDEDKLALYGDHIESGAYVHSTYHASSFISWLSPEDKAKVVKVDGKYVVDEEGYVLDVDGNRVLKNEQTTKGPNGETYYLRRFDAIGEAHKVEGWYEDGQWVKEFNSKNDKGKYNQYVAVWGGPQQFVLVDGDGNVITTYCADQATPTVVNFGYNMENLENASYYTEEEAAHIRSVAINGYWGTVGTTIDEDGNEVPVEGSLEYMRQKLLSSGQFSEEDLASFNDGVALTATQMAIWTYSNSYSGIKFVNSHYSEWGLTPYVKNDPEKTGIVSDDQKDEIELLFRIYNYLTKLEGSTTENKMTDTIITAENAISDMSVTVIKKAEEHENNNDDNSNNDAYVTDLSFALMVEPSGDNEESLKVTLLTSDGQTLVGRICGEKDDPSEIDLKRDENGNYCFKNVILTEGGQTFSLNLEGVQNLKHGVYLYSSEVREDTSSQTLVGMANGTRDFDVTMEISFNLDVDDGLVATEHIWRDEYNPEDYVSYPPMPINDDPDPKDPDPSSKDPQDSLSLSQPVGTGDKSALWLALALMSMIALAVINLPARKRENKSSR